MEQLTSPPHRHLAILLTALSMMTRNDDKSSTIMATSGGGGGGGGKGAARIIGSAVAGFTELALFHPVDTVAKRLMS